MSHSGVLGFFVGVMTPDFYYKRGLKIGFDGSIFI